MIDFLILYSLSLYWAFHILNRSDLLNKPRQVFYRVAPKEVVYASQCAFCFSFWVGVVFAFTTFLWLGGLIIPLCLFAAPVFNLLIDLVVRVLIRENEPPVVELHTSGSATTNSTPITLTSYSWSVPPLVSIKFETLPSPTHVGRRVLVVSGSAAGQTGIITDHYIDKDDCSGTYTQAVYRIKTDSGVELFKMQIKNCTLLDDEPPAASTSAPTS